MVPRYLLGEASVVVLVVHLVKVMVHMSAYPSDEVSDGLLALVLDQVLD